MEFPQKFTTKFNLNQSGELYKRYLHYILFHSASMQFIAVRMQEPVYRSMAYTGHALGARNEAME